MSAYPTRPPSIYTQDGINWREEQELKMEGQEVCTPHVFASPTWPPSTCKQKGIFGQKNRRCSKVESNRKENSKKRYAPKMSGHILAIAVCLQEKVRRGLADVEC